MTDIGFQIKRGFKLLWATAQHPRELGWSFVQILLLTIFCCVMWSLFWVTFPLRWALRKVPEEIPFGRIFGVSIKLHLTFLWFLAIMAWPDGGWSKTLWGLAAYVIMFVCITAHEFGHILVARSYGVPTHSVLLTPIGGMARINMETPFTVRQEFFMTIAGPLVNFALVVILMPYSDPAATYGWTWLVTATMMGNLVMAVFNLFPCFPMDGGRILRCVLSVFFSYNKATKITCRVAWVLAAVALVAAWKFDLYMLFVTIPLMCLFSSMEYRRIIELEKQEQLQGQLQELELQLDAKSRSIAALES